MINKCKFCQKEDFPIYAKGLCVSCHKKQRYKSKKVDYIDSYDGLIRCKLCGRVKNDKGILLKFHAKGLCSPCYRHKRDKYKEMLQKRNELPLFKKINKKWVY